MENMSRSCYEGTQLASKNMKPVDQFVRRLSNQDRVELIKRIHPCSVKLDVLQARHNFKIRCMIHDRYRCRCINRNKRTVKCMFLDCGYSVQNELIEDTEKHFRCKTTKINTSQSELKKKIKSLNCVNREFSKDSCSPNKNVCVYSSSNIIQEISNDSSSGPLYSHNFNRDNILKPEKCCPNSHCDKLAGVFVDVGSDLQRINYALKEDNDILNVSCETLFTDNKDIDYNLVKNVKLERYVEDTSKANEMNVQNLDTGVFNSSEFYTNSDWPAGSTNANLENMCDDSDSYDKEANVCSGYATTSIVGCRSGGLKKVNVKEEGEPLKETEKVQSKRESHLKFQNEVQTLHRTCSEHQITPKAYSRDDNGADGVEECNNKPIEEDVNTEAKNKNNDICQNHRNRKSKLTTDRHYVCKVCCKDFTRLCDLKAHKCIHTGDKPFVCSMCSKAFTYYSAFEKHKHIHAGATRPFGCSVCSKAFTNSTNLIAHKRIHTGERPFVCRMCGKTFIQLSHLQAHKHIHTGKKPFGCSICGKAFIYLAQLKNHKRLHSGERPFDCSMCGKAFKQLAHLKGHKRVHTNERPFDCSMCGKAFKHLAHLKGHKRIHTGERPFDCSMCGKAFKHLAHLKGHKHIHTGERPFGCSMCGTAFTSSTSLKRHKRIHTGERPFDCSMCGKAFTSSTSLKRHKLIHTGESSQPHTIFGGSIQDKSITQLSTLKEDKQVHIKEKPLNY